MHNRVVVLFVFLGITSCVSLSDDPDAIFGSKLRKTDVEVFAPKLKDTLSIPESWPISKVGEYLITSTYGDSTISFIAFRPDSNDCFLVPATEGITAPNVGYIVYESDTSFLYSHEKFWRLTVNSNTVHVETLSDRMLTDRASSIWHYPVSETIFLSLSDNSKEDMLVLYDTMGDKKISGIPWPSFIEDYELPLPANEYFSGTFLKHPDKDLFVFISKTANPYCLFFRLENGELIKNNEYMFADFTTKIHNTWLYRFFTGMSGGPAYVYLAIDNDGRQEILQFSWEGEPIARFLSELRITALSDHHDGKQLFGKTLLDGKTHFLKVSLN